MAQPVEVEETEGEAEEPERAMSVRASSTTHQVGIHPEGSGRVFTREVARLVNSYALSGSQSELEAWARSPSDDKDMFTSRG